MLLWGGQRLLPLLIFNLIYFIQRIYFNLFLSILFKFLFILSPLPYLSVETSSYLRHSRPALSHTDRDSDGRACVKAESSLHKSREFEHR